MKLIIDIPDTMIQELKDGCFGFKHNVYELAGCIMNGTPLPKRHGRLIDADALKNEWKNGFHKKIVDALMDDAPTVIEADTEPMYYPQVDGITPTVVAESEVRNDKTR